ncbi:MAG: class I SAM-dependent methyltransferase [Betaproteobacteria bacterium]|nr:class I SAM-dependent methyltransferase [Betaproteobacteria bacterium]
MNRIAALVASCIASAALLAGPSAAQSPKTMMESPNTMMDHGFSGAEEWAKVFDDPGRDASQKPREVIQALALKSDSVVADIGAGTGYFAVRFARAAPKGRVYGVDVEPDMVKYLAKRAEREGLKNLTAVLAGADDPRLPEKVDLVVTVNVFHHLPDRERYFRNLRGSLKPGGRVAIIDHSMASREGPPRSMRISPERVKKELKSAGYAFVQQHGFLPGQYFLVFRPAGS